MKKSILFVSGAMMILMLVLVGLATMELSKTMDTLSIRVHSDASEQILARNGGNKIGLEDSENTSPENTSPESASPESASPNNASPEPTSPEKEKNLDDVLIAYAPDSSYAKPLGETKTHDRASDKSQTLLTTIMLQVATISIMTIVALLMGTMVWRQVRRSKDSDKRHAKDDFRVKTSLALESDNRWRDGNSH